jgi:NADH-quinone oxidoreductase subunit C
MTMATVSTGIAHLEPESVARIGQDLQARVKTELDEVEFDVAPSDYRALCERVFAAGFDYPRCLSGSDMEYGLRVTLHLQQMQSGRKITIRTDLPYEEGHIAHIPTVCDLWGGVEWHEREAFDLVGIYFTGHPDHRRILLEDEWTIHPLQRKYSTRGYEIPTWQSKPFPSPSPSEDGFMPFGVASTPIPIRVPVAPVAAVPAAEAAKVVEVAQVAAPVAAPAAVAAPVAPAAEAPKSSKVKRWNPGGAAAEPSSEAAPVQAVSAPVVSAAAPAESDAAKSPKIKRWNPGGAAAEPVAEAAPQAAVSSPVVETPAPVVEAPAPVAEAAAPVAAEPAATEVKRDDYNIIEGIGPRRSEALYAAGHTTFAQLAKLDKATLEGIMTAAGVALEPGIESWPEQAALLEKGDMAAFEAYTVALKGGKLDKPKSSKIKRWDPKG